MTKEQLSKDGCLYCEYDGKRGWLLSNPVTCPKCHEVQIEKKETKEQLLAQFKEKFPNLHKIHNLYTLDTEHVSDEVESWLSQALDKYGAMEYERGRREEGKRCVQIIKNYSIAHADSLTEEEQVYEGTLQEMIEDIEAPSNQDTSQSVTLASIEEELRTQL